MIRTVVKILKKHLDKGRAEWNEINDMLSLVTNYDVLEDYPKDNELRLLARELIEATKGIEWVDLITIPSVEELKTAISPFLKYPMTDDELIDFMAEGLHGWLIDRGLRLPLTAGVSMESLLREKRR